MAGATKKLLLWGWILVVGVVGWSGGGAPRRRGAARRRLVTAPRVLKAGVGKSAVDEGESTTTEEKLDLVAGDACSIANPTACQQVIAEPDECSIVAPLDCIRRQLDDPYIIPRTPVPAWMQRLQRWQEAGWGSAALLGATGVSLAVANSALGPAYASFWSRPFGPALGAAHRLSVKALINEGVMAVFFFLVGLEIKTELRRGALTTLRTAALPCVAAVSGMVTPMAVYWAAQMAFFTAARRSLAAVTVPMATDIAFAMSILGAFRAKMPASAGAFLLTLATVDDLGAILVLATCFAAQVQARFLGLAAALSAGLALVGRRGCGDSRVFAAGGSAIWYALLRAGVSADIAGVVAGLCVSTRAVARNSAAEPLTDRLISRLSPISTFAIMPLFALANTAVDLSTAFSPRAIDLGAAPGLGIALGLALGKPLGIFGATWLADKTGLAKLPQGMRPVHLAIVSLLGGIGFTMCLLLAEVALPTPVQPIPKIAVLVASTAAAVLAAVAMSCLPDNNTADGGGAAAAAPPPPPT